MYDPQQAANMVTQGASDLGQPIQGMMQLPPFIQQLMDGVVSGQLDPDHAGIAANNHLQQLASGVNGLRTAMGGAPGPAPTQLPVPGAPPPPAPVPYGPPAPGPRQPINGPMVAGPSFSQARQPVQVPGAQGAQGASPGPVRTYGDLAMLERVTPTLSKFNNDKATLKQLDIADKQLRAAEAAKAKAAEGEANRSIKLKELDAKDKQFRDKLEQHKADMSQHWQEVLAKLSSAERTATNKNATMADLMAAKLVVQQQLGVLSNQTKLNVNNPDMLAKDPEAMAALQELQRQGDAVQKHAQQLDAVISRRLSAPPPTSQSQTTTQTGPTPAAQAAQAAGPQGQTPASAGAQQLKVYKPGDIVERNGKRIIKRADGRWDPL